MRKKQLEAIKILQAIPFKDCYNNIVRTLFFIKKKKKNRINADQVHALWNSNKFPHYAFREFYLCYLDVI